MYANCNSKIECRNGELYLLVHGNEVFHLKGTEPLEKRFLTLVAYDLLTFNRGRYECSYALDFEQVFESFDRENNKFFEDLKALEDSGLEAYETYEAYEGKKPPKPAKVVQYLLLSELKLSSTDKATWYRDENEKLQMFNIKYKDLTVNLAHINMPSGIKFNFHYEKLYMTYAALVLNSVYSPEELDKLLEILESLAPLSSTNLKFTGMILKSKVFTLKTKKEAGMLQAIDVSIVKPRQVKRPPNAKIPPF
jgi:hypothetical protein